MQEQITKKEVKKEAPKFIKLSDLTDTKQFVKRPLTLTRNFKYNRQQVSILLNIEDKYFPSMQVRPNGKFLTSEKFNLILLQTERPLKDSKGRDLTEWKVNAPVRFITGSYKNRDDKYKAVEILFQKGLYVTHFFDFDQVQLLDNLEEKHGLKIEWHEFPEAIDYQEEETLNF